MKFTSAALLAASASTATAIVSTPFGGNNYTNDGLSGGCGACKPFTIDLKRGASDPSKALTRDAILVNGTIPGPALHLKVGECVDFKVINHMGDKTGIHFHGIRQLATPWSDGAPGLTQNAIKDGETYTYRWLADEQGVYFYHGHYKSQMMDGLYGAIVISAADDTAKPYSGLGDLSALKAAEAKTETIFTSDWSQFTAAQFLDIEKTVNIDNACTDSIVLNGYGSSYCYTAAQIKAAQRPQVPRIIGANGTLTAKGCIPASNALVQGNFTRNLAALPSGAYDVCTPYTGKNYTYEVDSKDGWASMSLISPAGFAVMIASIDNHKLYVYELNGQYITPQAADTVNVFPGDRVTFFVQLNQPAADYTIRVANDGLNQVLSGYGVLKYKGSSGPSSSASASINLAGSPTGGTNTTVTLFNPGKSAPFSAPVISSVVADKTFTMSLQKNPGSKDAWEWVLNGASTYGEDRDDQTPFLYLGPENVPTSDLVLRTDYNDWVDIIFKVPGPLAQPHPIHKHANKFYVLGSGQGAFNYTSVTAAVAAGVSLNFVNPPFVDTFTTPKAEGSATWMVIRYQANTPGAWFMHCHIQTHFAGGMAVAILDGVNQWPTLPTNPGQICSGNGTHGGNGNNNGTNGNGGNGNGNGGNGGNNNGTNGGNGGNGGNGSGSTTTTSIWGGWGDWTAPGSQKTGVPKGNNPSPAVPTGHNGGDPNYGSADWSIWSSINSAVPTSKGAAQDPWGGWNGASATTTSSKGKPTKSSDPSSTGTWSAWDPAKTASASTWASWDPKTSVKASSTVTSTWATWATSVAATTKSSSASWSSWTGAASPAAASASGVSSYSGAGSPAGIATYHGAASSIKAGSVMVGAFVLGAAALLL